MQSCTGIYSSFLDVSEHQLSVLPEFKGGTFTCSCNAEYPLQVLQLLAKVIMSCFSFMLSDLSCSNAIPLQLQRPYVV